MPTIIFGDVLDDDMGEDVRVTVIATGFDEGESEPVEEVPRVTELKAYTPKTAAVPVSPPDRATYLRKGRKVVGGGQLPLEDLTEEVLDIRRFSGGRPTEAGRSWICLTPSAVDPGRRAGRRPAG